MDKEKLLTQEEIAKASGGFEHLEGKMARVYSLNGGNIKLYESSFRGWQKTYREAPNGTEMEVDPTLQPGQNLVGSIATEAGYWVCYNRVWLFLNQSEVRFEWL